MLPALMITVLLAGAAIVSLILLIPLRNVRGALEVADEVTPGGLAVRLMALALDMLFIAGMLTAVTGLCSLLEALPGVDGRVWMATFAAGVVLPVAYAAVPYFRGRQTPGKRMAGLRLETHDGSPYPGMRAIWRGVLVSLSATWCCFGILFIADMITLACHARKRALHDLLAGSRVMQVGRPPILLAWSPLLTMVVLVLLLGIIRTFFLQTFFIPASSMTPTLREEDRVITNRLYYQMASIRRGDIIVFRPPRQMSGIFNHDDYNIKRVIAVPGDSVQIKAHDGIYINGKCLKDGLAVPGYDWPPALSGTNGAPYTMKPGEYFVLGDNRDQSYDSHIWSDPQTNAPAPGVPRDHIVGKASVIFWPFDRIGVLR